MKCLLDELKLNPENITKSNKLKLKELCQKLNTKYDLINKKGSIHVIQKKINKRKKNKKNSGTYYYQNELKNLLRNRQDVFFENAYKKEGELKDTDDTDEVVFINYFRHHIYVLYTLMLNIFKINLVRKSSLESKAIENQTRFNHYSTTQRPIKHVQKINSCQMSAQW